MGWLDQAKSGSGGTVEGVITDYTFWDTFPFGSGDDDKKNDNIYMLLEVTPEGADEPTKRPLYLGSGQYLRIEDGDRVLVSSEDDGTPRLYEKGEVYKFMESLVLAGFPETRLPDINEERKIDLRPIIGTRIRLVNEIDEAATKEFGKRKVTQGKHKGKEFNRTFTKVAKVLELPSTSTNGHGKLKSAVRATATKTTTRARHEEAEAETPTISTKVADKFLVGMVEAQPKKSVDKQGLALAITRYAAKVKMDGSERDALRAFMISDEFAYIDDAADRGIVEVSKKGVITLPED